MTAAQRFLNIDIDIDTLTPTELAGAAEAMLLNMVPCDYCGWFVPQRFQIEFYLMGGCEVCDDCEAQFQARKGR
jgi:hypothetical protein